MDLTDDNYEENTDPMDMDLDEEDTTEPMEIDITMDSDDEDLYCPTSSQSPQSTLSPQDIEFLDALDEPIFNASSAIFNKPAKQVKIEFKPLPKNLWLKQGLRNSLQDFLTKFDVANIGLRRWEEIFWVDRISMRHNEDRVAGQFVLL
jgi:hypothetical protein